MSKEKKPIENGIYFQDDGEHSTHFIAYKDGKILDPYNFYQFPNTHGFCQFFAFFLYINDTEEFRQVNFNGKFVKTQYNAYVNNSYECFHKILNLLKKKKYEIVYNAFDNDFQRTNREKFGIRRGTRFNQFLEDAEKIPFEQFFYEIGENYKMYSEGIENKKQREEFEKKDEQFRKQKDQDSNMDQEKYRPDESLCVQPTEGETQFEAFQAIIANSFRGGRNSVYSKLLKVHNIKLIEKDIHELVRNSK